LLAVLVREERICQLREDFVWDMNVFHDLPQPIP
jgi:hypothetical protein